MTAERPIRALLVDPSLFTGPYDAALTQGLVAAGVHPMWATRPTRAGDKQEIPAVYVDDFFYRWVDEAASLPGKLRTIAKGLAHLWGMLKLLGRIWRRRPDVIHFQWVILPFIDSLAMWLISRRCPIVLTVHDTVPFNGERLSLMQNLGFYTPIKLASRVIVHTQSGRQNLIKQGVPADKIVVIPHGPLRIQAGAPADASCASTADRRWTVVLFGEMKPYKGIDLMVEALADAPESLRDQLHVIVAGRPRMEMSPLLKRVEEAGLGRTIEFRMARQTEEQMAELFAQADCFAFPYRQIDASGVYFLIKGLGKWIIASRVGVFAEDLAVGVEGALIEPGDIQALRDELARAVSTRVRPAVRDVSDDWRDIGCTTRDVYRQVMVSSS